MEMPHVLYTMLHHDEPLNAAAPRISRIDIWIDTGHFKYVWVDHPATEKLDPARSATNVATSFLAEWTA